MRGDRARGAVLYGCATTLLVAGAIWWFRAAPREQTDPQIEQWTRSLLSALPDRPEQLAAGTVAMAAGSLQELHPKAPAGRYQMSMACAGSANSALLVRLSQIGSDGDTRVTCDDRPVPVGMNLTVADAMQLNVSVSDDGPVVFRYLVLRAR